MLYKHDPGCAGAAVGVSISPRRVTGSVYILYRTEAASAASNWTKETQEQSLSSCNNLTPCSMNYMDFESKSKLITNAYSSLYLQNI